MLLLACLSTSSWLLLIFDFYCLLICIMLWLFAANKDVFNNIIWWAFNFATSVLVPHCSQESNYALSVLAIWYHPRWPCDSQYATKYNLFRTILRKFSRPAFRAVEQHLPVKTVCKKNHMGSISTELTSCRRAGATMCHPCPSPPPGAPKRGGSFSRPTHFHAYRCSCLMRQHGGE